MTRVLVVDDEPEILLLVATNVRAWGWECVTARDAADGLRMCAEQPPDILLLDIAMPGTDGPQFLAALRQSGIAPPHVVLLSALSPTETSLLAAQLGVGWFAKPFTAGNLRRMAERLVQGLAG